MDYNQPSWSINLVMHTIVDHSASNLACFRETASSYRVTMFPTSHHPTHFDRVTYKHVGKDVRADINFMASDLITFVDGSITKTPSLTEISAHRAFPLIDFPWFIVPTVIARGESVRRGSGLGSLVRFSRSRKDTNCVLSYLVEESDRVWLRCRETGVFHFVRGIGVIAIKPIEASTSILSRNQLIHTISMSSRDRSRLRNRNEAFIEATVTENSSFYDESPMNTLPVQLLQNNYNNSSTIDLPISKFTTSGSNQELIKFNNTALSLFKSTLLLLRLSKRNNSTPVISEEQTRKRRRLCVLDDDHDFDGNSSPLKAPLSSVIKSWSFGGVSGLNIVNVEQVGPHVTKFCGHFFDPVTFKPNPGLLWFDLFGQDATEVEWVDSETKATFLEYRNTARAHVPVFNWAKGKYPEKPPFPEAAVQDLNNLEVFITSEIMPLLGFGTTGVRFVIEGMSFLVQTPACGISQVLHTDDDPDSEIGEWISILLPCHDQRGTVFFHKGQYHCFDKPQGVKPFVRLGDVIAWNKLTHMGSACQDVPLGIELRVCLFVFVHVINTINPTDTFLRNPSEFSFANRNDDDEELIELGPDFNFWRSGICPIIRVCVVCKHGISSSYAPFAHTIDLDQDRLNSDYLIHCAACVRTANKHPVDSLVCQWCRSMDCLDVTQRYPDLNCESENATVTDYVYQCLIDEKTCVHGVKEFCHLDFKDYIFVLFSLPELQSGCKFWLDFLNTYNFTSNSAPEDLLESDDHSKWTKFCKIFMANHSCSRARVLCWLSAAIGGIASVFNSKSRRLSFGNYPVYFNDVHFNSQNAFNSSRTIFHSFKSACVSKFNDTRLLKVSRRAHRFIERNRGEVTLRCSCVDYTSIITGEGHGPGHHVIEVCCGPKLKRDVNVPMESDISVENQARAFIMKCRNLGNADEGKSIYSKF